MQFDDLSTDVVSLLKQNGESYEHIKASVQKKKIYIQRSDLLIEPDDLIRRVMSNGGEETYRVIDPGFHEQFHGIPAGYQIDVVKLGLPEAKTAVQHITYNISGTNNRINQGSTDNSINISTANHDIRSHIAELREEINKLQFKVDETTALHEIIDVIEQQTQNQNPSKTVIKALLSGLPSAGNIASIGSLIVSLLG